LEDTLVIEYSPQVYEKEDTYKVNLSWTLDLSPV
jgi:hypothetical protein